MDISTEYVERCAASEVRECLNRFHGHWQKQSVSREQKEDVFKALISHIKNFPVIHLISEARKDIQNLRKKCLLIENDNQQFPQMLSEEYSENLLEEHNIEINRLQNVYKQNKALLDKLARYEEMWQCHCNLLARTHNPERLFHNRGAQLLKEEQDRKVSIQLPILRKNLLKEMAKREAEGNPLLVRGERFCDLVERQMLTHKENVTVPTKRKREISPAVKPSLNTLQKKIRFQSSVKSTHSPLQLLMDPMVLSVLYVWCQLNKDVIVSFWFGTRFKAMYLPWVIFGFNLIISGGSVYELVGILVGHLYFFLKFKYPQELGGPSLINTPSILYKYFPNQRSGIHGFGQPPVPRRPAEGAAGGGRHNWGRGQVLGDD